jgi:hypothetical protein
MAVCVGGGGAKDPTTRHTAKLTEPSNQDSGQDLERLIRFEKK